LLSFKPLDENRQINAYSLEYDNLSRLESADYIEIDDNNQIVTASQDGYNMAATYDLNGNIMMMNRTGATAIDANTGLATAYSFIDAMTYTYAPNSNELQKIQEATVVPGSTLQTRNNTGFKDINPTTTPDYTYDENGNVTYDANKGVTTTYNHLNLPTRFEWSATKYIEITYDAAGIKLTKTKNDNGDITIKHYVGGIEYNGTEFEAVYHAEGRAMYTDPMTSTAGEINNFTYEYSIKDHLGNSRVMFSDLNGNGQVTESEIIQVEHYYPFGMSQEGHGNAIISETAYTYNGKELNSDFGLDLHDYGARWYDASIGRWHGVDPLAEAFIVHSPYNYGVNNPIMMVDPDGRSAMRVGVDMNSVKAHARLIFCIILPSLSL